MGAVRLASSLCCCGLCCHGAPLPGTGCIRQTGMMPRVFMAGQHNTTPVWPCCAVRLCPLRRAPQQCTMLLHAQFATLHQLQLTPQRCPVHGLSAAPCQRPCMCCTSLGPRLQRAQHYHQQLTWQLRPPDSNEQVPVSVQAMHRNAAMSHPFPTGLCSAPPMGRA